MSSEKEKIMNLVRNELTTIKEDISSLAKIVSKLNNDPETIECPYCSKLAGNTVIHDLFVASTHDYDFKVSVCHTDDSYDYCKDRLISHAIHNLARILQAKK